MQQVGEQNKVAIEPVWEDWDQVNLQLSDLRQRIIETGAIAWRGIPNARLIKDEAILQWVQGNDRVTTIKELREFIDINLKQAINPSDLYALAKEINCQITISYSPDFPSHFDACFYPATEGKRRPVMPIARRDAKLSVSTYCIDPLKGRFAKALISQLKEIVRELPEYMRPASFVLLESFPMTPSGKLDRRALPAPERDLAIAKQFFVQPTTSTEKRLCTIWSDVLSIDSIGVTDDFFYLGGHSLIATKLVSRIREEFDLALPLRTIFEHPTIAGLAEQIERLAVVSDGNIQKDIIPRIAQRDNLPLSFSQARLWFLDLLEPNNAVYNMAIAFRLNGDLNQEALHRSLQEIIQHHEILRTTFESKYGIPIQVIHEFDKVPLTACELSHLQQEEFKKAVK